MRERKYWTVGASFSETEDVSGEFLEKGIWYDGYADNGDKKDDHMLNQMNVGDYLIMKSSSTKGPGHKISFTKLKGIGEILEKEDYYSFKMKWYEIPDLPKDFDYISYRKTIEQLRDDDSLEFTLYQIKLDEMKNYLNNIKSILEQKNQIILQGPPGTGKTYTAQDIAYQLIFGKELSHEKEERKKQLLELEKNNCYKFVQFHPSYTYEDFVRGITAKTNGQSIEYKAEKIGRAHV